MTPGYITKELVSVQPMDKNLLKPWFNYDKDVEVNHDMSGDSEYMFKVKMCVGASDKHGSTVTIGKINFVIKQQYDEETKKNKSVIFGGDYENRIISPDFEDKWDAVSWLINYIKGTNNE